MRTCMEYKINGKIRFVVANWNNRECRCSILCITWMASKPNRNKTFKRNFELKNVWPCKLHTKFYIPYSHCLILFHAFPSISHFPLQSVSGLSFTLPTSTPFSVTFFFSFLFPHPFQLPKVLSLRFMADFFACAFAVQHYRISAAYATIATAVSIII